MKLMGKYELFFSMKIFSSLLFCYCSLCCSPKVNRPPPPLKNFEFVFVGKTVKPKEDLKKMIQKMGGKVGTKVHEKVAAVVGTKEDVEKMGSKVQIAKQLGIQVFTFI